ncbi:sodium- and chloride-dependent glycine transporter 2-like [Battus philenor]|uniref:sodium- and chloride-dependent glycine transporter 2-like n=1 Tax=Battus philenor TaxID=42288 RepID=UPI0035CFEC6A
MSSSPRRIDSLETILNFQNRDVQSQWSVVWSTTHIPGMDNAAGGMARRPVIGRRRLHIGALTLGAFLTMHCRIAAAALTGGFFFFMFFFILAVMLLANPLRHFEVYLGQWSISGPGRAFRIIPMLDGIGMAICINAIVRAITCCTIAAIAAMYVLHSVRDDRLPYTYCRDFELRPYDPILKDSRTLYPKPRSDPDSEFTTLGFDELAWRNFSLYKRETFRKRRKSPQIAVCKETYSGGYPSLFNTPPYNFFYIEVMSLREDQSFKIINTSLVPCIIFTWVMLWLLMIIEHCVYKRMVWNNMRLWLIAVPWTWVILLVGLAVSKTNITNKAFRKYFRTGAMEVIVVITDAFECALYIHSASTGTELIHGKGLNHYGTKIIPASGHIDPHLNSENVWHSGLLLILTALHSGAAALCAFDDCAHPNPKVYNMYDSTLWIIPLYSKCTLVGNYTHLLSTVIFGGMMFSYMTVAFLLLKTALHTIFEYRVKLVFKEQTVVAGLMLSCMALSLIFATNGGLPLLESVDVVMSELSTPYVCLLELIGLFYVYRGHDFLSDINIATEDNTCSTRISSQWHIIPLITLLVIGLKLTQLKHSELPKRILYVALTPLAAVLLAVPLRAFYNACLFLRLTWRQDKT